MIKPDDDKIKAISTLVCFSLLEKRQAWAWACRDISTTFDGGVVYTYDFG